MTAMTYDPEVCREITDLLHERQRLKDILWALRYGSDSRLLEARNAAIEARIEALMQKPPYKEKEGEGEALRDLKDSKRDCNCNR